MYYIYVLKCANNDLYIGYSKDLKSRIKKHFQGKIKSTKSKMPLKLIYYESYLNKFDAIKRERQLKLHKTKKDLQKQIKNSLI